MKSVCFFSSYIRENTIPYYVKCYLEELSRHFDEVMLVTNSRLPGEQDYLSEKNIIFLHVNNEGLDFGMWHKAMKKKDIHRYDRIGLVNDSCILFRKLDDVFRSINENNWDYCGLLDSRQIAYHIQSYFIVINKPAIKYVESYFDANGLVSGFENVIRTYEIGLAQHLLSNNLKIGAVFSSEVCESTLNPSFSGIEKLIRAGFPVIKRKIIVGNYRKGEVRALRRVGFNFNALFYLRLIKNSCKDLILDFKSLKKDYQYNRSVIKLHAINIFSKAFNLARSIFR